MLKKSVRKIKSDLELRQNLHLMSVIQIIRGKTKFFFLNFLVIKVENISSALGERKSFDEHQIVPSSWV